MYNLKISVKNLKGIGTKKTALFKVLGIETLEDALCYYPRDYEYRNQIISLSDAKHGQVDSFLLHFKDKPESARTKTGKTIIKRAVSDSTKNAVCIWYNQNFRFNAYDRNKAYFIRGKVKIAFNEIQIQNPLVEEYSFEKHQEPKILPLYSLTKGLAQRDIRNLVAESLKLAVKSIPDIFNNSFLSNNGLVSIQHAMKSIHFPESAIDLEKSKYRLAFEELFMLKLGLSLYRKSRRDNEQGIIMKITSDELDNFLRILPFNLTKAQFKVIREIYFDFSNKCVMNRLLQGDVGSGKTIVAAAAIYCAYLNGYQSAIMVPTEMLAKQHYSTFYDIFRTLGLRTAILSSNCSSHSKDEVKKMLLTGQINLLIGTHAIIQNDVEFKQLALVLVDEQHRFGVRQRAILKEKGKLAHLLVMSATPIPRTLSQMIYGDLDISIIDELPPGKKTVLTYHVKQPVRQRVYEFVLKQVLEGRQAYIVCPLIEKNDASNSRSANDLYNELSIGMFSAVSIELLHGDLLPQEKDKVMQKFINNEVNVLVCTTIVEVGINIPNASVMVIESAERFGLAQLHQLRGRVGRGKHQSYCIMITDSESDIISQRMQTVVKNISGFDIAEMDLHMRGPGEYFGTKQHGLPELKTAFFMKDYNLIEKVNQAVTWVLQNPEKNQLSIDNAARLLHERLKQSSLS